jgi:hypothetical protein
MSYREAEYVLRSTDHLVDGGLEVVSTFRGDQLDALLPHILWFIRASGYSYVDGITLHKGDDDKVTFRL